MVAKELMAVVVLVVNDVELHPVVNVFVAVYLEVVDAKANDLCYYGFVVNVAFDANTNYLRVLALQVDI